MAKAHRLRHLQVRKARQDDIHVPGSGFDQRLLQVGQQLGNQVDFSAQPQAHIGGDLVVAAAAGVQALAGVAGQLRQARLNVQVDVFQVQLPVKGAGLDFLRHLCQALLDGGMVVGADDALGGEHFGMRQAAGNVGLPQAFVKEHAGGVALDQVAHRLRKKRRPGLRLGVELVVRRGGGGAGIGRGSGLAGHGGQ